MDEQNSKQRVNIAVPKNLLLALVIGLPVIAAGLAYQFIYSPAQEATVKQYNTVAERNSREARLDKEAIERIRQYIANGPLAGAPVEIEIITVDQLKKIKLSVGPGILNSLDRYRKIKGDKRIVFVRVKLAPYRKIAFTLYKQSGEWLIDYTAIPVRTSY